MGWDARGLQTLADALILFATLASLRLLRARRLHLFASGYLSERLDRSATILAVGIFLLGVLCGLHLLALWLLPATGSSGFTQVDLQRLGSIYAWSVATTCVACAFFGLLQTDRVFIEVVNDTVESREELKRTLTGQKAIEDALRESEAHYRHVLDAQEEFVVRMLPDGTRTFVNDALCRYYNVSRDDLLGENQMMGVVEEDRVRMIETVASITPDNPAATSELRVVRPDGTLAWQEWKGKAAFDEAGKLLYMQSVGRDVTALREAEAARRESEERFRTLFEHAPEAILVFDAPNNCFLDANPGAVQLLGYSRSEILRRVPADICAPIQSDGRPVAEGIAEHIPAVLGGKTIFEEWLMQNSSGETSPCELRLVRLPAAGRDLMRVSLTDIRERRRAEEEAERHREQLLEAEKMIALGTLVAGVAHEINNPNHFIMLNVPILRSAWRDAARILDAHFEANPAFGLANLPYSEMREEVPELMQEILNGAERIKLIVSELRDYTRGEGVRDMGPVSLNDALRSALTLVADPLKHATNRFSIEYGENLPKVRGNMRRIEQVFINLIANAYQALTDKDQAVEVTSVYDSESGELMVTVRDEGAGMRAADFAHIRDPFYTTKRDSGGTGLGLSIAARIIEQHKGRLTYESKIGAGTTARLYLPALGEEG